jgi:hypothetical protein
MAKVFEHLMLDLETLGLLANCAILSVGLVPFMEVNPEAKLVRRYSEEEQKSGSFYTILSQKSQVLRETNAQTLSWWKNQSPEARKVLEASANSTKPVSHSCWDILEYMSGRKECQETGNERYLVIWGNGAAFDNAALKSLIGIYHPEDLSKVWNYKLDGCYRTVLAAYKSLEGQKPAPLGVEHNALDDCYSQIKRFSVVPDSFFLEYSAHALNP